MLQLRLAYLCVLAMHLCVLVILLNGTAVAQEGSAYSWKEDLHPTITAHISRLLISSTAPLEPIRRMLRAWWGKDWR
jgi:hypothetical protein